MILVEGLEGLSNVKSWDEGELGLNFRRDRIAYHYTEQN